MTTRRRARRLLAALQETVMPSAASSRALVLETIGLPLIACALAFWLRPQDPLLLEASFPWLWFAPLLVALRYGTLPGLIATMPLIADWLLQRWLLSMNTPFPQDLFFGGILLTLLGGEFADVWHERIMRVTETNAYLAERTSRLTRRHLLLNLSHDRLEHELLMRTGTLRDALADLRKELYATREGITPRANALLEILAQYINVQAAALYPMVEGDGRRIGQAVARIGQDQPLDEDDPLLRAALDDGEIAHVGGGVAGSRQLVVAPLRTSGGRLLGVVAISQIPFFSLNEDNMAMLAAILGFYADCVDGVAGMSPLLQQIPSMPAVFADELWRLQRLNERYDITSLIVVLRFPASDEGRRIAEAFPRIKRGLDLYWREDVAGMPTIAVLMPLCHPDSSEGFLRRIERWLEEEFGVGFAALGILADNIDLSRPDALARLSRRMTVADWGPEQAASMAM